MRKPLTPPILSGNRLSRWLLGAGLVLLTTVGAQAQISGPKTIGTDYPTVAAAITALNAQGVGAGGVTFNVPAGYTETFASPTAGAITLNNASANPSTAANPVVFQKSGTGANPVITAGTGTSTTVDAIISLAGTDYVTIDGLNFVENAANTTAATQAEYGIALFRASATDGAQNNTIRNCGVTLLKTNTNTIGIYGAPSAATSTTAVTATATTGANSGNRVYGNSVSNALVGIYFAAGAATTIANYDQNNEIGSVISPATTPTGNNIGNFGGTSSGYGAGGNYQNGLKVQGNTINSTLDYTAATPTTIAASTITSTLRGIYTPNGVSSNLDITGNNIILASGATSSALAGLENVMGSTPASNTVNITNNTFTITYTLAVTSGSISAILNTGSPATLNITGNTVSSINQGGTGAVYGINNSQSSTTANIVNNTISNVTRTGASGSFYGYSNSTGGTTQNLTGNTVTNVSLTSTSTIYGFNLASVATESQQVSGNTVSNITNTSASSLYGIYCNAGSTASQFFNNTVTGLSGNGTMGGIYLVTTNLAQAAAYGNTIGNLSNSAASSGLYGIYTSVVTTNIYRNKVYGLASLGSTGASYGIYSTAGTTINIYNNLVGNLTAPASTGLAVGGIYINSGTTVNLTYNTIYLTGTSTGAAFGAAGVYSSSSPTLTMLNNIIVNSATPTGTGVSAAFRRSSTTLTTYSTASNNNLFYTIALPYAAQPIFFDGTNAYATLAAYKTAMATRDQASVTELPPFASTTGTAPNFLHITPGAPTQIESAGVAVSITTDYDGDTRSATPDIGADEGTFAPPVAVAVTGTTYTQNNTSTIVGQTNQQVTGVVVTTTGQTSGPTLNSITFSPGSTNLSNISNAKLYVSSTSTFSLASSTLLATTGTIASPSFTLTLTTPAVLASGNNYYFLTYDIPLSATPGATIATTATAVNVSGTTFTPTLSGPAGARTIIGALNGTYYITGTVGSSPDPTKEFATLTAAAAAYNTRPLSAAVTFVLRDATYSTAETFPIVFAANSSASATNTLTIQPGAGVTSTITAGGSVMALTSTNYITIDGSNTAGGTTRNLTLTNTTVTTGTYNLALLVQTGQTVGNQNTTIRNVAFTGGGVTTNTTYGIILSGADNDNATLQNNSIVGVTAGIQAAGTAIASVGGLDNLLITGNVVGPTAANASQNINGTGLLVSNTVAPTISNNTVQNVSNAGAPLGLQLQNSAGGTVTGNQVLNVITSAGAATGLGIFAVTNGTVSQNLVQGVQGNSSTGLTVGMIIGNGTTNTVIDRNRVLGITEVSTAGNGVKGIEVQTAATSANVRISNNFVQVTAASGFSGTTYSNIGIRLSGTQSGINLYYNSVNMTGTDVYNTTSISSALTVLSGCTVLDIRNNALRNSIVNSGNTGAKAYAFYSAAAATAFTNLDFNDYFVSGTQGVLGYFGAADRTTLAALQTATTKDASSINVDPQYLSTTDLHAVGQNLNNLGTPIAAVTTDIDGETRNPTTPDIGADELHSTTRT